LNQKYPLSWKLFLYSLGLLTIAIIAVSVALIAFPKGLTPSSPLPQVTLSPPPVASHTPSPTLKVATPTPSNTATVIPSATTTRPPSTLADGSFVATPIPLGSREFKEFVFAVGGDSRGGDEVYLQILRQVEEDDAAFFVNTGDLVNNGTTEEFKHFSELMHDFTIPFFPVPGNHDSPDGLLDEFLEYSGAPAEHYSFDYGQGHFVVIDSHLGGLRNREIDWLEADLSSTDQPLKLVFLHHPPFDPDGTDHIMLHGNEKFMALIEEYEVSYVFAGHIHAYVEGLRNDVRYIITGGGGAPLYGAGHPNAFYHYVRVTVSGSNVITEVVKIETP
jgi:Icc-related predicted phosphoesterase